MRHLGTLVIAVAVLLALLPVAALAARKPTSAPPYRCTVQATPANPHPRVPTPRTAPRRDPQPVVVVVPRLRCTGRNPQGPQGGGGVGGQAGGAGNGHGAVGNGDGHLPFTGFPVDVSLAVSLGLAACGTLLVVLALPRRRAD